MRHNCNSDAKTPSRFAVVLRTPLSKARMSARNYKLLHWLWRTIVLVSVVITNWASMGDLNLARKLGWYCSRYIQGKGILILFSCMCSFIVLASTMLDHAFPIEIRAKIVRPRILQFDIRMLFFPSNKTAGIYCLFRPYYFYILILCCVHILCVHICHSVPWHKISICATIYTIGIAEFN
jgi:hypothetical protein